MQCSKLDKPVSGAPVTSQVQSMISPLNNYYEADGESLFVIEKGTKKSKFVEK